MRDAARPGHLVHGTADGYNNHGCRCPRCRRAWAAYCQQLLSARARRANGWPS